MNLWIDRIRIILCFIFLLLEGFADYRNQKIFLPPVAGFFLAGIIMCCFQGKEVFVQVLSGALVGSGILVLAFFTKNRIGYGDGFVLIATGALLGFRVNVMMLFLGLFLASLKGIWILISGKGNKNASMPFVPFLIPGLTLSLAIAGSVK